MSIEEIKRFNEDVIKSEEFQNELKDVGSDVDKLIKIANSKGYDFNEDDLKAAAKQSQGKLNEEQLEDVAGGATGQVLAPVTPGGIMSGGGSGVVVGNISGGYVVAS